MPDQYHPQALPSKADTSAPYVTRPSECATLSRHEASAATLSGFASGIVTAGIAVVRKSGRFISARTFLTSGGTAVTGLKIGVWTPDGVTLLASTADLSASAATNTWVTGTLDKALGLMAGDQVILGIGEAHTTTSVAFKGVGIANANVYWPSAVEVGTLPYRGRNAASYTAGGALPGSLLANAGPGIIPLVELVLG